MIFIKFLLLLTIEVSYIIVDELVIISVGVQITFGGSGNE